MANTPISVFIITKNEEKHLEEVLQSVTAFDEVVLVDSGSTDRTLDIAEQYGARIIHQEWLGFSKQKSFAMSQCKNEWVLNLDGDEVLSEALASDIQQHVDSGAASAYRLNFEDLFWGKPMHPRSRKRSIVRVYLKSAIRFPEDRLVHENVCLQPGHQEKSIKGTVKHYGYASTAILMDKQNTYSSLKAQEKFQKNKKPSVLKLVLIFPLVFIKTYFFRNMWLSGKRGLVVSVIDAQYAFLKEAKLFEHWFEKSQK